MFCVSISIIETQECKFWRTRNSWKDVSREDCFLNIFSSSVYAAWEVLNITPEIVHFIIYFLDRNALLCKWRAHNVMSKYYMENDLLTTVSVSRSFKHPPDFPMITTVLASYDLHVYIVEFLARSMNCKWNTIQRKYGLVSFREIEAKRISS